MQLTILLTLLPLVSATFPPYFHLFPRQAGSSSTPCMTECAAAINATTSCATSPDPYCGCTDWLSSGTCDTCLAQTNVTLLGFLNTTFADFIEAVCKCQRDTCRDLILAEKQCALQNASDSTCPCPATLRDAGDCYACLKLNDPGVAPALDARVAFCESVANASGSATVSGSAGATASQSSLPTFVSVASGMGIWNWWWAVSGVIAVVVVNW